MLHKVFPLVLADSVSESDDTLADIDWKTFYPAAPDISMDTVEHSVKQHLSKQALGTPLQPNRTVSSVLEEIK